MSYYKNTKFKLNKVLKMTLRYNAYQQPVGEALPNWKKAKHPDSKTIIGQYCQLERINVKNHALQLYDAFFNHSDPSLWTYLLSGPFNNFEEYREWLKKLENLKDPFHYAIINKQTQQAIGSVALMRIDTTNGVIEIGSIIFSNLLKHTKMATEAIFLLIQYAFETLTYRRIEWKCDCLNSPSRKAALRYGFTFEGIFRQALVTHERNRDTAWYSIIDREYESIRQGFISWLDPNNFNNKDIQIKTLQECRLS